MSLPRSPSFSTPGSQLESLSAPFSHQGYEQRKALDFTTPEPREPLTTLSLKVDSNKRAQSTEVPMPSCSSRVHNAPTLPDSHALDASAGASVQLPAPPKSSPVFHTTWAPRLRLRLHAGDTNTGSSSLTHSVFDPATRSSADSSLQLPTLPLTTSRSSMLPESPDCSVATSATSTPRYYLPSLDSEEAEDDHGHGRRSQGIPLQLRKSTSSHLPF
jgi:hypothetical protein